MTALYGNPYYTPEQHGCVGDGVTDDTAALTKMAVIGRAQGYLDVKCTPGKIYTHTNPWLFAGIKNLRWFGNGASMMNIKTLPVSGFQSNYQAMQFGTPLLPNGASAYVGGTNNGIAITTTNARSLTVTVASGNCPVGKVLIYGFDRIGISGFPPAPSLFEYNEVISANGATGNLRYPTQFLYDAQWPALGATLGNGQPAIIALDNVVSWTNNVYFEDFTWLQNPLYTGASFTGTIDNGSGSAGTTLIAGTPTSGVIAVGQKVTGVGVTTATVITALGTGTGGAGTYTVNNSQLVGSEALSTLTINTGTNGACQPAGGDNFLFEHCSMATSDPTMAGNVEYRNCNFYSSEGTQGVQLDKLVENVIFKRCKLAGVATLGTAIKNIEFEDCFVSGANGLAPLQNLTIRRGIWYGADSGSSTAMFGNGGAGCARILIDRPTIIVSTSSIDRVMQNGVQTAVISIISTNTIAMTRTVYNASGFCRGIRMNSILRDANGIPAFRVTRLPYTTGDLVTGDVWVDGDNLSNFSGGDTLYLPLCPDVEYINPLYEGPFAEQVTSFFGTGVYVAPFPSTKVRDRYNKDASVTVTSQMSYSIARASNVFTYQLGGMFAISHAVIVVSRAAGSAATLQLQFRDPSATLNQIYQSIDLATVGKRVIRAGTNAATITVTIATPGVFTWTGHGLTPGAPVQFTTSGALPTGLVARTVYYVTNDASFAANTFSVSDTPAHALAGTNQVATSVSQSGTHTGFNPNGSGISLPLGADIFGASGIGTTNAQMIRWTDAGASLSQPNQPQWSATFHGAWISGYEGMR